jgi:hypothetical protein
MSKRNFLILSLAASFGLASCASSGEDLPNITPSKKSDRSVIIASTAGDPGIQLKRLGNGMTTIQCRTNISPKLRNNPLFYYGDSLLIKIGDVYAKNKTVEELNKLLSGPINSKVEVVSIAGDQLVVKALNRYSPEELNEKEPICGSLLNMTNLITDARASNRDDGSMGEHYHLAGNDFVAAAYFVAAINPPKFTIPMLYDDGSKELPAAMDFFARTGMWNQFDNAARCCDEISANNSKNWSDTDCETLTKSADILAHNNKLKDAQAIYDKLYQNLSIASPQNKMHILKGRAEVIERKDGDGAALKCNQELAAFCTEKKAASLNDISEALESLVAYFTRTKHWDLAETEQSRIVELNKGPTGSSKIFEYQKNTAALLDLSGVYRSAGNYAKERDALQQSRDLYGKNLNTQEQIILERLGGSCLSDIGIKMAQSYCQDRQYAKASKEIDAVATIVSEALGSDGAIYSQLQAIKNLLNEQVTSIDASKVAAAFARLDNLQASGRVANDNVDAAADNQLAREASDEIARHSDRAYTKIETLTDHELAKTTHTADNITRLINLIRSVETPLNRKKAFNMLKRLDACFEEPDLAYSASRLFQETELALLSGNSAEHQTSVSCWTAVDSLLHDMESNEFGDRAKNSQVNDTIPLQATLGISYIYTFLQEPQKAFSLAKYAQKYSAPRQDNLALTAYEAILFLQENKTDEARKRIALLRSARNQSHSDYSKMLIALSNILFQTGNTKQALEILDPNFSTANTGLEKILAERRALLKYKLGQYQEALAELKSNDSSNLFADQTSNYSLLKAELLAKTGQPNEAVLVFLESPCWPRFRTTVFHQAIIQAKKIKSLPSETIKALIDAAQYQGAVMNAEQLADLAYIGSLAKSQKISNNATLNIDSQLSSAATAQEKTTGVLLGAQNRAQALENAGDNLASYEWANLARIYFSEKRYAEGTSAMLHALQLKSGEGFNNGMYHPGNLRGDLGFTQLLEAKRYDDAEKILKQSLATHKSLDYMKSGYIEKAFLAELFIQEGKFEEAKKWAEEVIFTLPSNCELHSKRYSDSLMNGYLFFDVVDEFISEKQFQIAQKLIDEATRIQLSVFGPRHALFLENYQSQAKLFLAQNRLSDAEAAARKALALEKWLGGSGNTGRITAALLASILRQEGHASEADQVSITNPVRIDLSPFRMKLYSNGAGRSSHSPPPEIFAGTAEEPLKSLLADAVENDGEGTRTATEALTNLTKFYIQQKRYDEAEKVQLHQLQILDDQYGQCSQPKAACFLSLAEIYLSENKTDKAMKFASLIMSPPESEPPYDQPRTDMRYANVLFSTGKKLEAILVAKKVEKDLLDAHGRIMRIDWGQTINDCLRFMERAGLAEEVKKLKALQNPPSAEQLLPPRVKVAPPPMLPQLKALSEAEIRALIRTTSKEPDSKSEVIDLWIKLMKTQIDDANFDDLPADAEQIQKLALSMQERDRQQISLKLLDLATILIKARRIQESHPVFVTAYKILDSLKRPTPVVSDSLLNLSIVLENLSKFEQGRDVFAKYCAVATLAGVAKDTIDYQKFEHKELLPPEAPDAPYRKLLAETSKKSESDSPDMLLNISQLILLELKKGYVPAAKKLAPRLADGLKKSSLTEFAWPLDAYLQEDIISLYKVKANTEARLISSGMLTVYARDTDKNIGAADGLFRSLGRNFQETQKLREEYLHLVEARNNPDPKGLLMTYISQLRSDIEGKYYSSTPMYTEKIVNLVRNSKAEDLESVMDDFAFAGVVYQQQGMFAEAEKIFKIEIELDEFMERRNPHHRHTTSMRYLARLYEKSKFDEASELMLKSAKIGVGTLPPAKQYLSADIVLATKELLAQKDLDAAEQIMYEIDRFQFVEPDEQVRNNYWAEGTLSYSFEKLQNWDKAAFWAKKHEEINAKNNSNWKEIVVNLRQCASDLQKAGHLDEATKFTNKALALEHFSQTPASTPKK